MSDVASAHRALESGSTVGKLVLLTEGDTVREEMKIEEGAEKKETAQQTNESADNAKLLES